MNWMRTAQDGAVVEEAVRAAVRKIPGEPDADAWLAHLAWLRQGLDAGTFEPSILTAEEAAGLRQLRQLQAEFGKKFRACPHCGGMTEALLSCDVCGQRLIARH